MKWFSAVTRVAFCATLFASMAHAQLPFRFFNAGATTDDLLGRAVSGVGDVNADGFSDYALGLPGDDTNGSNAGSVQVISGADGTVLYTFFGNSPQDQFGSAVSGAGDVDNDGYDDIIVGAFLEDSSFTDAGAVYLYSGLTGNMLYQINGDSASDNFGIAVSSVGDVNGDSFDDFAVGAWLSDAAGVDSGAARVYSGFDGQPLYTFIGDSFGDRFGISVAGAGDVNNDGTPDIMIGAILDDNGSINGGMARVFSGSDGSTLFTFFGTKTLGLFGFSVDGVGDVNGDGFADVVVGAPQDDSNGMSAGMAKVYSGANGAVLHTLNGSAGEKFGESVSGLGDINGDGISDFGCGAPGASVSANNAGAARFYNGADATLIRAFNGFAAGDAFGTSVAGMGDANNDGFHDVVVGAPFQDVNAPDSGASFVLSVGGALTYGGTGNPFFTLNLEFIKNPNPALASLGTVRCSGAAPGAAGLYGISLALANTLIFGGFPLLIAADPTNLQASDAFGFDLAGEVSGPAFLQSDFTAGVVFYLQFFATAPVPAASNGLQLLVVK